MKTNELKKGNRVQLQNGWFATIEDNQLGIRRMATVEGFVKEMGSIYSHDIRCRVNEDGSETTIELTKQQIKCRDFDNKMPSSSNTKISLFKFGRDININDCQLINKILAPPSDDKESIE